MPQQATKEAIKIAFAVTFAICFALWLEWDKPYWAGMAALVMGMNESFGHAIHKGRNRILGTIIGAASGVILISLFSQDRFWFLGSLTLMLALCVFMASNKKYGYIATISFIVCLIVASVGGFDSETTFTILLLRLQETFLGVITYSLVYRFIWPKESEEAFFLQFSQVRAKLVASYEILALSTQKQAIRHPNNTFHLNVNIQTLYDLVSMPLKGSYRLSQYRQLWKDRVKAMFVAQYCLTLLQEKLRTEGTIEGDFINQQAPIKNPLLLLKSTIAYLKILESAIEISLDTTIDYKSVKKTPCPKRIVVAYQYLPEQAKSNLLAKKDYLQDGKKALKAVSIFVTSLLLWIYLPIPDSYMFPLNAGVFATILAVLPDNAVKDWMIGYLGFGALYIAQYVFLLPGLTEVWQLAIFYFANIFLLWKVFYKPQQLGFRVIGGNMLMMMTMGALHLTPVYDVETSLSMLVYMMFGLMVTQFYIHLFSVRMTPNS